MLGVRTRTNTDLESGIGAFKDSLDQQYVTQIGMAPFVRGSVNRIRGWTANTTPDQAILASSLRALLSRCRWRLIQASTMLLPPIEMKTGLRAQFGG